MNKISVELIPRSRESLEEEVKLIKDLAPLVNTINIPDLLRFDLRSWQATSITSKLYPNSIPHIRAMDFPSHDFKAYFDKKEITKHIRGSNIPALLVIRGDKPKNNNIEVFDTKSLELISFVKKEFPDLKIYGAIDQYRGSTNEEIDYIKEKINSGADGFFTQPFFDIEELKIYGDKLNKLSINTEIFWGVSPVCTERSKNYWEKLNKVQFPNGFDLSLDGNIDFAREALSFTKEQNSNIYFMPIKIDLKKYLSGIFS